MRRGCAVNWRIYILAVVIVIVVVVAFGAPPRPNFIPTVIYLYCIVLYCFAGTLPSSIGMMSNLAFLVILENRLIGG